MASALIALISSFAGGFFTSFYSTATPSLTHLLDSTPSLSEFATLLKSPPYSSLYHDLESKNGYQITILVPNNAAFAKLNDSEGLGGMDGDAVEKVLRYHVLNAGVRCEDLDSGFFSTWLDGGKVEGGQVVCTGQEIKGVGFFGGALREKSTVLSTHPLLFSGGFLYPIDTFLIPLPPFLPTVAAFYNLTAFATAIDRAALAQTITDAKDVIIFAPSKAAFAITMGATDFDNMPVDDLMRLVKSHVVGTDRFTLDDDDDDRVDSHLFGVGCVDKLEDGARLKTLGGRDVLVEKGEEALFVSGARVVEGGCGG